jgi:hypothetical protein
MPATMRKFLELFDFSQMSPLLEQKIALQQMMAPMLLVQMEQEAERSYQQLSQAMAEEAERSIREDRVSRTEEKTSDKKTKTESGEVVEFHILYYNPELGKVETIDEKMTLQTDQYSSPEQQAVEETVGQKSIAPSYEMIAQPTMHEKVNPYMLEYILSRIEIDTPGPFKGGAAVHIPHTAFARLENRLQAEGLTAEVVALEALRQVQVRKESLVEEIGKEIIALEEAIQSLQETDKKSSRILDKLPPLSRIRYQALLKRKKKVERTLLADLLISDVEFLEAIKSKLKKMGPRQFVNMLKKFKGLFEKKD